MGAGAQDIGDTDLDAYVAQMLVKEAKAREARFDKEGVKVYFSDEEDKCDFFLTLTLFTTTVNSLRAVSYRAGPSHRPSKRFLLSLVKNVDDHNQALLRQEQDEITKRKLDREELKSEKERRQGSGNRLFALARNTMGSSESSVRPRRKLDDERSRARLRYASEEDDDEAHRAGSRRSSGHRHSRSERRSRDDSVTSHDRRSHDRRSRHGESYSQNSSRRSKDDIRYEDLSDHAHRSSRHDRRAEDDLSDSHASRRRHGDTGDSDSVDRQSRNKRRRRSHSSEDEHTQSDTDRRHSRRRRRRRHSSTDSHHELAHVNKNDKGKTRERAQKPAQTSENMVVKPSIPRVRPASRSPSPLPDLERGQKLKSAPESFAHAKSKSDGGSKMDKYFEASYDPRLDVSVAELTDPYGFIAEGNFDEWTHMLDVLKTRKEEKNFRTAEKEAERQRLKEEKRDKDHARKVAKTRIKVDLSDGDSDDRDVYVAKTSVLTKPKMDDYASATGPALLNVSGYAKKRGKAEWRKGQPNLAF